MTRAISLLVALVVTALLTAGPAHAHGGPIKLEVQGDGGQGVNATVTYQNDGHMVTDQVVLSYTAVTPDGRTAGPVRMIASSEGQAFYRSEEPLPIGNWTVTVTATRPSQAQKTVAITSTLLPTPKPVATDSPTSTIVIVLVAVGAVLILGAVTILGRRRARRVNLAGPAKGKLQRY
ncbi:hypothetical protein LWC34_06700 [Kibdelosporangium philippinense]|uniref:Copper resistance protein CopC n=1 Tax=Kibdelosporangium philippinense TaxID=211113 RepID=A0ABS8Z3X5_9PSEU|nr:hypothetical protein [Kibdelosporangium philippinense]MCE7002520.1 hypothetical protein [Kibdelosporangium philippinense]